MFSITKFYFKGSAVKYLVHAASASIKLFN